MKEAKCDQYRKLGKPTPPAPERPAPSTIGIGKLVMGPHYTRLLIRLGVISTQIDDSKPTSSSDAMTKAVTIQDNNRRSVSFHSDERGANHRPLQSNSSPVEARKVTPTSILKRPVSPEVIIYKSSKRATPPPSAERDGSQMTEKERISRFLLNPPHAKGSPLSASYASRPGDVKLRAAVLSSPTKAPAAETPVVRAKQSSSPFPEKMAAARTPKSTYSRKKRQTVLPFERKKGKARVGISSSAPAPRTETILSGSTIDISSDTSDSLFDSEIDEDELRIVTDRSSQEYLSGKQAQSSSMACGSSKKEREIPETQSQAQNVEYRQDAPPISSSLTQHVRSQPRKTETASVIVQQPTPLTMTQLDRRLSPDGAGAQLLREYRQASRHAMGLDEIQSGASSTFSIALDKATDGPRLQRGRKEEEALRAEQKPRHQAYIRQMKREEAERNLVRDALRRRSQPGYMAALKPKADVWDDDLTPVQASLEEHFGDGISVDGISVDEEIDRVYHEDDELHGRSTGQIAHEQLPDISARIEEIESDNENVVPGRTSVSNSSSGGLPSLTQNNNVADVRPLMHGTQSSVRTADLAPPYPSSGKVRSPTPSQRKEESSVVSESKSAVESSNGAQHKASSATSMSITGDAKGDKTPTGKVGLHQPPRDRFRSKPESKTPGSASKAKSSPVIQTPGRLNGIPPASAPAATTTSRSVKTPQAQSANGKKESMSASKLPSHGLRINMGSKLPGTQQAVQTTNATQSTSKPARRLRDVPNIWEMRDKGPRASMVEDETVKAIKKGNTREKAEVIAEQIVSQIFGEKVPSYFVPYDD